MRIALGLATITLTSIIVLSVGCTTTPTQEPDGPTRVIPVKAAFMCNARPWAMANELYSSLACVRDEGAFSSLKEKDICRYQLRWIEEQMSTYVRCYSDAFDLRANEVYADVATSAGEMQVEIEVPELAEIRNSEKGAEVPDEAETNDETSSADMLVDHRKFSLGMPQGRKTAAAPLNPDTVDAIHLPISPNCTIEEKNNNCRNELVVFRRQLDDWVSKASDVAQTDIERFHQDALACFSERAKRAKDSTSSCALAPLPRRMP